MTCSTVFDLTLDQFHLAPERFQYKGGANADTGAGLALTDVTVFDIGMAGIITVWRSPDSQRLLYVINGHHRVELAKATGFKGELRAQVLDSGTSFKGAIRHGVSDVEARTYGALLNISEGRGDALDAAKLMRDTAMSDREMSARGISLTDKLMAQAVPLSHLDDSLFHAAILGRIEVSTAVIIGRELADNVEAQREIYRLTQQRTTSATGEIGGRNTHLHGYVSDGRLLELIRLGKTAPVIDGQDSLFGGDAMKESLLPQKAELLERAKKDLRSNVHVFGSAVRHSTLLESGGTVVDCETGQRISKSAAVSLEVLNRTAYHVGTAAGELLNHYAIEMAKASSNRERRKISAEASNRIAEVVGREAEQLLFASKGEEAAA